MTQQITGRAGSKRCTAGQDFISGLLHVWSHPTHPLEQADGHGCELEETAQIQSGVGLVQWGGTRCQHAVWVGNTLHYQWGSWTLTELQSLPTPPFARKREPLTWRISLSQTGLLSMASNSWMLPFLPGFNDLSPLNYAPLVTVIFSDLDRWMELWCALFGVLTESELIFCLAWLILARQ